MRRQPNYSQCTGEEESSGETCLTKYQNPHKVIKLSQGDIAVIEQLNQIYKKEVAGQINEKKNFFY